MTPYSRYANKKFQTDYIPTIADAYEITVKISGEDYKIRLFDSAGKNSIIMCLQKKRN